MDIPFMRLDRQFSDHKKMLLQTVESVLTHGRVLQGPEVKQLERKLSNFFNMPHVVSTASGTDALILSLKAIGLRPGAKVAVTSLSFVSSASCIVHAGGIPLFVYIE